MRRILLACFALVLLGTSCDTVGAPSWAARVDGTEISMSAVESMTKLSAQSADDPAATTTVPFQLSGEGMRGNLSFLIRWDLVEKKLDELGEEIPQDLLDQSEQSLRDDLDLSASTRRRIVRGLAAERVLAGVIGQRTDDEELAEVAAAFEAENQGLVCIEAIGVPLADRADVDDLLAQGATSLESVLAAGLPSVQALTQSGQATQCLAGDQLSADLTALIGSVPPGQIVTQEQPNESVGTVVLYFRQVDPFAAALQSQDGQRWLDLALAGVAKRADIEILSTIGSGFDPKTLTVTPPARPTGVATTTTAPLVPQSG